MKILNRDQIFARLHKETILTRFSNGKQENITEDITQEQLAANKSVIQTCSIDLHIGSIFVPEQKKGKPGSFNNPEELYDLKQGGTVLIKTEEEIALPLDLMAICMPRSRTALRGLLVTNMSHIDPGYTGPLHLTLINMGKLQFNLRKGDVICSILLIQIDKVKDGFPRHESKQVVSSIDRHIDKLSKDFLDITNRASKISRRHIRNAQFLQIGIPVIVALITAAASIFGLLAFSQPWDKPITDLNDKLTSVSTDMNILKSNLDLTAKIKTLEEELATIQGKLNKLAVK